MDQCRRAAQLSCFILLGCLAVGARAQRAARPHGAFEREGDVGGAARQGALAFDSDQRIYTITGGGENMWSTNDAFHFVWKKCSGDIVLAATVAFLGQGGDPHRKACLMVRQSLDADSAYVDAALHGDGLTSLQYRPAKGARTYEIQSNVVAPHRLRLLKRGKYASMEIATAEEELRPAGGSVRLLFSDPFYVGLVVCAHNRDALERATFSHVELLAAGVESGRRNTASSLEVVTIASKDRRVIYWTTNQIEAPNWSPDGGTLLFNSKGRIYRLPVQGGIPLPIETGFAQRCNNDHGISPDGTQLAISDHSAERHSLIYLLPLSGGVPKRITARGPSYWHGWAPDGKTLAYCAERNGEFDIYTIPTTGGEERQLTTAPGLDDGPDYSPDGRFIYFNSERSGAMQIWRMRPDGRDQEQVTGDNSNNWFPHPSPDGKWIVFLSYHKDVKGHPENEDVELRLMSLATGKSELLAELFGGQGTINVPSWSPDSRKVAFVSYY